MVRGVVALVALVALPSAAAFRGDPPPPSDYAPIWSPDASAIAYLAGGKLHVMRRDGTGSRRLAAPVGLFSPDWRWVAYAVPPATIRAVRPEGQDDHLVATGREPVWSPDGERLAFTGLDGSLYTVRVDGTDLRRVTSNAGNPVWSPDGTKIAFGASATPGTTESDLGVVNADGTQRRMLRPPDVFPWRWSSLAWSPDGSTIAVPYDSPGVPRLFLVRVRDGRRRSIEAFERLGILWWSRDGGSIFSSSGVGLWRFEVQTGRAERLTRFGAAFDYARNGREFVFAGEGRCPARFGIYRLHVLVEAPVRLTNDCRILGTTGADSLSGTQHADVILGRAGNDRLSAFDDFYYEGDTLDGGPGNDVLVGSMGTDVLRGGRGRDRIEGGPAPDTIYAHDGERDVVSCGTYPGSDVERDVAYVDRRDAVRDDCENVYLPGVFVPLTRTSLSFTVWPRSSPALFPPSPADRFRKWTLACAPPRGTFPHAAQACARLARAGNPFAFVAQAAVCRRRFAERGMARVVGRFRGRTFTAWLLRRDGCEIGRWNRIGIPVS
jgi:hypothetical protein